MLFKILRKFFHSANHGKENIIELRKEELVMGNTVYGKLFVYYLLMKNKPNNCIILDRSMVLSACRLKILKNIFPQKSISEKIDYINNIDSDKQRFFKAHRRSNKKLQKQLTNIGASISYIEFLKENELYGGIFDYFLDMGMIDREVYETIKNKLDKNLNYWKNTPEVTEKK
ncbi:hypothetical protein ABK040_015765 [Willaertia magna]